MQVTLDQAPSLHKPQFYFWFISGVPGGQWSGHIFPLAVLERPTQGWQPPWLLGGLLGLAWSPPPTSVPLTIIRGPLLAPQIILSPSSGPGCVWGVELQQEKPG